MRMNRPWKAAASVPTRVNRSITSYVRNGMKTYSLHGLDNDSNMCGSTDRLFDELVGIPICRDCGYKTDLYFVNPAFRVKRRVYDLSETYDGYSIASIKFIEACKRFNLEGVEFIRLPSDPEYFLLKPTTITKFDSETRKTRFNTLCNNCGFYNSVAGATPAFLLSEPITDLSGTDVVFGSGNSRSRMLIATERAKTVLTGEKLKGLEFKEAIHNLKNTPDPKVVR